MQFFKRSKGQFSCNEDFPMIREQKVESVHQKGAHTQLRRGGNDISPLQCLQLQTGFLVHVPKVTSQGPVS